MSQTSQRIFQCAWKTMVREFTSSLFDPWRVEPKDPRCWRVIEIRVTAQSRGGLPNDVCVQNSPLSSDIGGTQFFVDFSTR